MRSCSLDYVPGTWVALDDRLPRCGTVERERQAFTKSPRKSRSQLSPLSAMLCSSCNADCPSIALPGLAPTALDWSTCRDTSIWSCLSAQTTTSITPPAQREQELVSLGGRTSVGTLHGLVAARSRLQHICSSADRGCATPYEIAHTQLAV